MAVRYDCDECGDRIADTMYFARVSMSSSQILAETHEACFAKHVSSHIADWFGRYGLVEFGFQLVTPKVRPIHRTGTF